MTFDDLGFAAAVKSSFSFLSEFGFVLVSEVTREAGRFGGVTMRYESPSTGVFLSIPFWMYEFEIDPLLGHPLVEEKGIRLYSVVTVVTGKQPVHLGSENRAELSAEVERAAEWTQNYGRRALEGDLSFFTEFRALILDWDKAEGLRMEADDALKRDRRQADRLRMKANEAWQSKDYARVVALYDELGELATISLLPSEEVRRRYARKHHA